MLDEQLRFYARRNTYVYTHDIRDVRIACSHTQKNELCRDVLTMHAIREKGERRGDRVLHCGTYCALVHLSCEMLCEIISCTAREQWGLILEAITKREKPAMSELRHCEVLDVFLELEAKTMSEHRRACLMLPYKVLSTIVHTLDKEK